MSIGKLHKLCFNVEARITQSVIILEEGLTIETIKEGLSSGTYVTSIDYDQTSGTEEYICRVNDDSSITSVALIKKQEAEGDISVY